MDLSLEMLFTFLSIAKYLSAPSFFILSARMKMRERMKLDPDQELVEEYNKALEENFH
jgi:hypothetical protein